MLWLPLFYKQQPRAIVSVASIHETVEGSFVRLQVEENPRPFPVLDILGSDSGFTTYRLNDTGQVTGLLRALAFSSVEQTW